MNGYLHWVGIQVWLINFVTVINAHALKLTSHACKSIWLAMVHKGLICKALYKFICLFTYFAYIHRCRLFGCYEALDGGELAEALADFTGGVSELMDLTNALFLNDEARRDEFYNWLVRADDNNSLMCAAIAVSIPQCCSSLQLSCMRKSGCSVSSCWQ